MAKSSDPDLLVERGPVVEAALLPHHQLMGSVQHEPVTTRMLVDTGAQKTLVSETICEDLGIPPLRAIPVLGVSGEIECPVYLLTIRLRVGSKNMDFAGEVIGMPSAHNHVDGLIGRDFLRHLELIYNGPMGMFSLRIP